MGAKETNVTNAIHLALSPHGFRLFKNQRYKGPIVQRGTITQGYANCGIGGDGGSDSIGYRIVTVTPEMVGTKVAVFTAIESKTMDGKKGDDQKIFINGVLRDGGIAGFARSEEEALKLAKIQPRP